MSRLQLIGLNHTTAPLEVRERIAFAPERLRDALAAMRQRFDGCEAVMLSTCNRVELYVARTSAATPTREQVAAFLAEQHGVPVGQFDSHLYAKADRAAVDHLFAVASSLDSMVLGETQILGQVRQSYETASESGTVGASLNPLFQRAIAAGKEVMSSTALGDGRLSVAGAAVEYAQRIFETLADKTVLCVGAGKMAALALRRFAELRPGRLLICNRDVNRAVALAAQVAGEAVAFATLEQQLVASDVVISSTGAAHPIITRPMIEAALKQRRYRPMFLIDIAVPRDVDPRVGEIESVYLYNIDDLQRAVSATHAQRSAALEPARAIVARHVEAYISWHRQRELGPAIDRLYKRYHALAREEVERVAGQVTNLSAAEKEALDELARRLVNKLLHGPVKALHEPGATHAVSPRYLHALEKLFDLDGLPNDPMPTDHGSGDGTTHE